MRGTWQDSVAPTLALFTSASTLVCCALPALLISVGAGAVMAGLTSAIPEIMWLSAHKGPLFFIAGAMLLGCGYLVWQQRSSPCPIEPDKAAACMRLRRYNAWVLGISTVMLLVGVFFAYLWPLLYL